MSVEPYVERVCEQLEGATRVLDVAPVQLVERVCEQCSGAEVVFEPEVVAAE